MMKTNIAPLIALLLLSVSPLWAQSEHGHDGEDEAHAVAEEHEHDDHHAHEDVHGVVEVDSEGRELLDIQTQVLTPQAVPELIEVPGEVALNEYRSARVTTRIPAQIVDRYARLGDNVKQGQPLALLTSVDMAEAQGALQVAAREWARVRELGRSVVGAARYVEARVAYEQAHSKLLAYGMSEDQIAQLLGDGEALDLGRFRLLAPQDGTVLEDDFVLGQYVQPGESLFLISDESSVWVEAMVPPVEARRIEVGAAARVRLDKTWHDGEVVQLRHRINEATRTEAVRIELTVEGGHPPHPGQFVEVAIVVGVGERALAVPEQALNRNLEGRWTVFVQEAPGRYRQVEVERLRELPGKAVVRGLEPGVELVTHGAFYLSSELAKSGFSVHNH